MEPQTAGIPAAGVRRAGEIAEAREEAREEAGAGRADTAHTRRETGSLRGHYTADKAAAQGPYEERKRNEAEARRVKKAADQRRKRIEELEARIADREQAIKEIESSMSSPGFYENRDAAQPIIDRHQALMWEVGDLMSQWEALQTDL